MIRIDVPLNRWRWTMKRRLVILSLCVCLLVSLCSCRIKSDKKISEKTISDKKAEFEEYLTEAYPGETFTVEVWQEYGEDIGAAGLPDYEGYMLHHVVTDSKGNRFKISTFPKGKHSDDYQQVLDGTIYYNEKGQHVYFDENGDVLFVSDR